ncbi:MAG: ABC transporter ATP-binding protein [Alphaproteobacteria bacterium]|nr:ABC transporter ATP-binding protein [Alphaproteobacteria bacterium]
MSAAIALAAKGLKRVLPGAAPVVLIDGIDCAFASGEFVAISGPSGSGKSSLLYLLGLLDEPSEGEVTLGGRITSGLSSRERTRLRRESLGFVFQFHFLLPEFTVLDNILIPMRKAARLSGRAQRERAEGLLADLNLADQIAKYPEQLSGGQRQRVAIARSLANDPPVILADEPTGNLDSKNAATVFEIFGQLARERRKTVLVVTHDPELARRTDRQLRIVDGKVAA